MKKVYKALDEHDGKLLSWGVLPPYELEYIPEETIRHPNIFVFDTLENALATVPNGTIWECETPETRPARNVILNGDGFDFFEDYWGWGGKMWSIPAYYLVRAPVGTVLTDELTLVRRVQ